MIFLVISVLPSLGPASFYPVTRTPSHSFSRLVQRGGGYLSQGLGAWASSFELPHVRGPVVPRNERWVPGKLQCHSVHHVRKTLSPWKGCDSMEWSVVPPRGLATLVVVARPRTCQDSHLAGKRGASQGSPLLVAARVALGTGGDPEPCTVDTGQLITSVWGAVKHASSAVSPLCPTLSTP